MRESKDIRVTPKQDCNICGGDGLVRGDFAPVPFGVGSSREPDQYCDCVIEQLPDDEIDDHNIYFKFPEPAKEMRFTWTYGPESRNTIFINDNSLPNPKERGIAGITCGRIGNAAAERLAKAWCRALDMLALLHGLYPIIEAEANRRESVAPSYDKNNPYWTEMTQALNGISHEIDLAHGREVAEHPDAETCPHGWGFVEYCPDCKPEPDESRVYDICLLALTYIEDGAPMTAADRLRLFIDAYESKKGVNDD
jgi:hypothetical protein